MKAIDVRNLTKTFGNKTVVNDVTLSVDQGEISGFLGPNGSGKTTTIRVMCGLLTPDSGEGTVLGYDLRADQLKIKRQVGYMTQKFSFYTDLTIEENLYFVARLYGLTPARKYVRETLEHLGLTSRRHQLSGLLSGGWKQRLALAACIMHKPRLLLLDEPTAGVDPKARREFWDEIHMLAADGMTIMVSTHYMDEAERCHRINYIAYGTLLTSGTVNEVIEQAGLHTYLVSGKDVNIASRRLQQAASIHQVASFGNNLHVVGKDREALKQAIKETTRGLDITYASGETTLEDVFIQYMTQTKDNMANGNGEMPS